MWTTGVCGEWRRACAGTGGPRRREERGVRSRRQGGSTGWAKEWGEGQGRPLARVGMVAGSKRLGSTEPSVRSLIQRPIPYPCFGPHFSVWSMRRSRVPVKRLLPAMENCSFDSEPGHRPSRSVRLVPLRQLGVMKFHPYINKEGPEDGSRFGRRPRYGAPRSAS